MQINESSLVDLYQSAVAAFPNTKKRQHAIHEINISNFRWIPYLGVRTLFVKALAQNETNGHEYGPLIVFKNVRYHPKQDAANLLTLTVEGQTYFFEPLSIRHSDVLVRCQCKDWSWRLHHYNFQDRSCHGPDRKPYESITGLHVNPLEYPGLCKHLMQMMRELSLQKIFVEF